MSRLGSSNSFLSDSSEVESSGDELESDSSSDEEGNYYQSDGDSNQSDNETRLRETRNQGGAGKHPREYDDTSSDTDSSFGDDDEDAFKDVLSHKHRERKRPRRKSSSRHVDPFRSSSPLFEWDDSREITPPGLAEESPGESQIPSDAGDTPSDVDWGSFLCEDSETLPASNWEAEFREHQEMVMNSINYKSWGTDNYYGLSEDPDDAPWYPCDPDNGLLSEFGHEMHTISRVNSMKENDTICFGMIHKARVKILPQASEPLRAAHIDFDTSDTKGFLVFKVVCEHRAQLVQGTKKDSSKFILQPRSAATEINPTESIAVLNRESSDVLSEILEYCTFEAYCPPEPWASIEENPHILVDVVLYGLRKHCREVGDILTNNKVYLQEPDFRQPGLDYHNPHFFDLSAVQPDEHSVLDPLSSSLLQMGIDFKPGLSEEQAISQKLMKQKISAAFKNMTRAQSLKQIEADIRIRTPLLSYQKKALDFIMQREIGPIAEDYRLWKEKSSHQNSFCKHIITGDERRELPAETGGGILADEMGLGKTLTMLSATIRTSEDAKAFASNTYHDQPSSADHAPTHSRATLVVVPSPLLLNEWRQEIKLHCVGFTNINIYHGHGREGNPKILADSDIVLSTYHTIAHEASDKKSPLWQIKWFRIILDEAHIIRRMSTKLFKAMKKLRANFRWCLTGTPVQNSLEDLAALISFIRSPPLDDFLKFRKHVITPLMKGSENGVENLRQLLDSLCLRRTKELLHLPEAIYESRLLPFSAREEQHYVDTRDELIKKINQNRMQPKSKNSYLGVFQLQLQLRRLCNHGTFQKLQLGAGEFDPEQAIAHLKKQKDAKCEVCAANITGIHGIEETRSGTFTTCGHLLCAKCIPKMIQALQRINGQEESSRCSLCHESIFGEYLVVDEAKSKHGGKHLSAWQYFTKDGCSTKISAVVEDIEKHKTEGKSIVFSCWTRSLDLVGIFLKSRNIAFVRLDGSHSLVQRKEILVRYQHDDAVKILLMTTGTGAIGLNLTVANCVYLLEPQWNPMVEHQAIARVLRLGQKRNVKIVRYIMKGTVEELELQTQQVRKLEYAKVGWKGDEGLEAEGVGEL